MRKLDIEEIRTILPQRYPFLMIDKVVELEAGKRIVAIKNVSFNEQYFLGHFPEKPIMPGALIIEAMAQASIILFCGSREIDGNNKLSYYLGSVKVRFLHPVVPGDQLKIVVEPLKMLSSAGIVKAQAFVCEKEVASAEISFMAKKDSA